MSSYLKRLLTRGDISTQAIRPIVHSASPIAEEDQRIGLAGFNSAYFGAAESLEPDSEANSLPTPDVRAQIAPAAESFGEVAGRVVRRKPAGPDTILSSTAIFRPNPAGGEPGEPAQPKRTVLGKKPGPQEQGRGPFPLAPEGETASDARLPGSNFLETALPFVGPARSIGVEPAPAHSDGEEESVPAPRNRAEVKAVKRRPQISAGVGKPRLEPAHPGGIASQAGESISPDPVPSGVESEGRPRVVIGRLNIEVVPSSTEVRTAPAADRRPLSAESVSVIGPLGGIRPALRFSLKHR